MRRADSWNQFLRFTRHDLVDPFPGRLAQAWRIALACALTTMMASVYGIPEAAISCYLIFFVMKPDAAEGSILAVALTVLVVMMVMLLLMITRWTIDAPALRIVAIVVTSLILLYLGSASQLGELGGIIALVLAFVLTLLDDVPFGEAATRAILYAWLMSTMPMACVLAINLTMGRKPITLLRQTVAQRLLACADWLEHATPESRACLREQVWEGQEISLKRLGMTRLLALGRGDEIRRLARALQESYRMAMALLALPQDTAQPVRDALATQLRQAAQALGKGQAVPEFELIPPETSTIMDSAWGALRDLAGTPARYPAAAPGEPFLRPDASTNPEHVRYAIKTTAAAVICYLIYTAVQWQGIHTAMITCYVAALGSVAETAHKLVLRIIGCLIGAALGIGSILFLMPHMSSVGAIMLLVFFGTFIAAWVAVGNERVSYAGVQIALAFLLTVLQGFGPTFDMDTARDRVVGIILGNFVLYVMFTQFWPVSVIQRAWDGMHQSLAHLASMARVPGVDQSAQDAHDLRVAHASKVAANVAATRQALGFTNFETYRLRPSRTEVRRVAAMTRAVRATSLHLLLSPAADAATAHRLDALARQTAQRPPPLEGGGPSPAWPYVTPAAGANAMDSDIHRLENLIDGH